MKFALNLFPLDIVEILCSYCEKDAACRICIGLLSWALVVRCSRRITYVFTNEDIIRGFNLTRYNIKKHTIITLWLTHCNQLNNKAELSFSGLRKENTFFSGEQTKIIPQEIKLIHSPDFYESRESHESYDKDNNFEISSKMSFTKGSTQQYLFFETEEISLKVRRKSKTIVPCDNFKKTGQKNIYYRYKKIQHKRRLAVQKDRLDHDEEEYIRTIPIHPSLEEIVSDCTNCHDYGCRMCDFYYDWE